jgi:hypothetical protein
MVRGKVWMGRLMSQCLMTTERVEAWTGMTQIKAWVQAQVQQDLSRSLTCLADCAWMEMPHMPEIILLNTIMGNIRLRI